MNWRQGLSENEHKHQMIWLTFVIAMLCVASSAWTKTVISLKTGVDQKKKKKELFIFVDSFKFRK